MKTTKRFTPQLLERFHRIGRGKGVGINYVPWHRVSRSDPSSHGRSHLQYWEGRQRELLSDHEWEILFFVVMLVNLLDVMEQFPLSQERGSHELSLFRADIPANTFLGTHDLAKRLGIKPPKINGAGESADWIMTTDLLLVLKTPDGKLELLAVAIKPKAEVYKKRTLQLLEIERAYWTERGVTWLLVTPALYDQRIGITLRSSMPWALGEAVTEGDRLMASATLAQYSGCSLTFLLEQLASKFGSIDHGQRTFWQAVWSGQIPMDLRRGWRPHIPITVLPEADFWALNPVASRRSLWI